MCCANTLRKCPMIYPIIQISTRTCHKYKYALLHVCVYVAHSVFYNPLSQFCVFVHACVIIVVAPREGLTTTTKTSEQLHTHTTHVIWDSSPPNLPQRGAEWEERGAQTTQMRTCTTTHPAYYIYMSCCSSLRVSLRTPCT